MTPTDFVHAWTTSPWVRMAHIARYSSIPILHRESVAEHSYFVCLLSMAVGRYLEDDPANGGRIKIDFGLLLQRAVTHDLDEALSGDIIRPFKYADPETKIRLDELSAAGMTEAMQRYPGGNRFINHWWEAKVEDLEGSIVAYTDLWSVVMYARRELALGNGYARRLLKEVKHWIVDMIQQKQICRVLGDKPGRQTMVSLYGALASMAETSLAVGQQEALIEHDLDDPYIGRLREEETP